MNILLADSDWHFALKATQYFEAHGDFVAREVGWNVSHHAQSWQPDLVILSADYATPDVLADIQAMENRPAVLITEHMSQFSRAWSVWQNGGDELMMKPIFRSQELQQAVICAMENAAVSPDWTSRRAAVPA